MRLLTAIDQLFLLLENRNQPMHIGGCFCLNCQRMRMKILSASW